MTTEELARIIGVSRITVSKVINGKGGVAPATEKKIRDYIQQYNFEPNSQARSLVGKKEKIIGFFTTYSNESSGATHVTSHFATELTNLVINYAQNRDYKTLVAITDVKDGVQEIERFLNSGLVRGAILFGYETGNKGIKQLAAKEYPLVLVNQNAASEYENVAVVNMQDEKWAYYAIERLVELGHRRLLYLGCERRRLPAKRRKQGAFAAAHHHQDSIDVFTEVNGDFNEDTAYDIVKDVFARAKPEERYTGIFAANDLMAIGAINALKDLGLSVPEDVSVIGFDDISISKYLSPSLTTIHYNFPEIASVSVNTLIDAVEGKPIERCAELELEFVDRETLAAVPVKE